MKKGMKKIVSVLLCAAVFLSLTGCAPAPEQQDADAVRIALLCREDMDYNVSRYQKGMEMLKLCNEKIDTVEKKVQVLEENGEIHDF